MVTKFGTFICEPTQAGRNDHGLVAGELSADPHRRGWRGNFGNNPIRCFSIRTWGTVSGFLRKSNNYGMVVGFDSKRASAEIRTRG